jgi:hypothetical protein
MRVVVCYHYPCIDGADGLSEARAAMQPTFAVSDIVCTFPDYIQLLVTCTFARYSSCTVCVCLDRHPQGCLHHVEPLRHDLLLLYVTDHTIELCVHLQASMPHCLHIRPSSSSKLTFDTTH